MIPTTPAQEIPTTTTTQSQTTTRLLTTTQKQTTTEVIIATEGQTTAENQPIASTEVITTTEGQTIVGANTHTHSATTSTESTAITSVSLYEDLTTSVVTYNNSHCTCNCTGTNNKTVNELVEQLVSELRIDPKNTSSAKRKLVSVRDMSTPNNVIGSGMCFLLIVGVGFFLCPDFVSVVWWIKDKLCS